MTQNTDAFDPDELLALARLEIESGNISEALWKLKRITTQGEPPPGALSICGQLYLRLGLWDRACAMLQRHLEKSPGAVEEAFSLGLAHCNAGRLPDAMKLWDEVLQKHPGYVPALFYRALLRAQQGQIAPSRQDLEVLVKAAAADNAYLKPAKDLLQSIEHQQRAPAPGHAAAQPSEAFAAFARSPYKSAPNG